MGKRDNETSIQKATRWLKLRKHIQKHIQGRPSEEVLITGHHSKATQSKVSRQQTFKSIPNSEATEVSNISNEYTGREEERSEFSRKRVFSQFIIKPSNGKKIKSIEIPGSPKSQSHRANPPLVKPPTASFLLLRKGKISFILSSKPRVNQ